MAVGITCNNPPQADVGLAYSHAFPATGDTPPDVFDIPSGALPAGLSIAAATGVVSGTPTGPAGVSNFAVRVTDSLAGTATANCSITVNAQLVISTGNAPYGILNVPYSHAWVATGGMLPYVFSVQSGALPNGLKLNASTGVISGTPIQAGSFTFTVRVTDALGQTSDVSFGLWILNSAGQAQAGPADCPC